MATTRLSDVVVPEIVVPEIALQIKTKSAFVGTEAVFNDPILNNFASANFGSLIDTPKYNHITEDESNVSSDDPAAAATPEKASQAKIYSIKHVRNVGYSNADLVYALSQPDPSKVITDQLGTYWAKQIDKIAINSLHGVYADNVASNGGDMVYDISDDVAGIPTDAEIVSGEALIRAAATNGDNMDAFVMIVMHSIVFANLQVRNLVITIPDSNGVLVSTFMGKKVIVSDAMPVIAGTNRNSYVTALVGPGALRYGNGAPKTPLEVYRDAAAGNGEGVETLWSRNHFVMSPTNYSFDATYTFAGVSPTWGELRSEDAWVRTLERKQVAIAYLITNG